VSTKYFHLKMCESWLLSEGHIEIWSSAKKRLTRVALAAASFWHLLAEVVLRGRFPMENKKFKNLSIKMLYLKVALF